MCLLNLILMVIVIASCLQLGCHFVEHLGKPGPWWTIPLIGHLPCLGINFGKGLLKWKKIYGSFFFVKFGTTSTLILSDATAIKEAFKNPSLCGRPEIGYFFDAAQSKGFFSGDGPAAYDQRTFFENTFKDFGIHRMNISSIIQDDLSELLQSIDAAAETPYAVKDSFNQSVINSLWSCLTGKKSTDQDLKLLEQAAVRVSTISNAFALLGMFVPIISKLLPTLSGYKSALEAYQSLHTTIACQINQQQFKAQDQPQNVLEAYLNQIERAKNTKSSSVWNEAAMKVTFGDIFVAAMDTTSTTLEWAILLLSRNPEIQRKVQEEIYAVLGDSRSPSIEDAGSMPYCEAFIAEVHRFSSVLPIAVPHRAIRDTTFRGYTVPKNSLVLAHLYGVFRDPDVWEDPEDFRPERFIQSDGTFKKPPYLIPFSHGKRSCIGEHIGSCQLFLYLTNILQKFCVRFNGDMKQQQLKCTYGFVVKPYPFQVVFSKRVKSHL